MERLFCATVKTRKRMMILFIVAFILCALLVPAVGQNYDMSVYLPQSSESKQGIDILTTQFEHNGRALLMLENKTIPEVLSIKAELEELPGIKNIIWLDDVADLKKPIELLGADVLQTFYIDNDALLQIVFEQDDYAASTFEAIDAIKQYGGEDILLAGSAVDAYNNVKAISGNIWTGIALAIAIALGILFLTTNSFGEVILFLITIGIAIVINMGTNIIFGEISYMTYACAAILQLAVSMDYSVFLLHRFEQERQIEKDPAKAMVRALKAAFSSILSSGMTTIVGFLALVFMSYTMGSDLGLVLAKGVFFSLISVLLFLPALTVSCVRLIDKTKHRRFLPSLMGIQKKLGGKARYAVLAVLAVVCIVSYLAQSRNDFLYSASSTGDKHQEQINQTIDETFGSVNSFVVLVPRGSAAAQAAFADGINANGSVKSVQGLYTFIDATVPEQMVPESVSENFLSEAYSRYIIEAESGIESEDAMQTVEYLRDTAAAHFDEHYVTGASAVIYDIREATSGDFSLLTTLSILFVGIILLITFRSILIPFILLFVIQTSIWVNMAVPYFEGTPMIFIGYIVISAIQLGATIDYAILMTNSYKEVRATLGKRDAAEFAAEKAGASIMISAFVLSAAGFVVAGTFAQPALAQLGLLIGRGGLLSGAMTLLVLPQLLTLLDKPIQKTTLNMNLFKRRKRHEI